MSISTVTTGFFCSSVAFKLVDSKKFHHLHHYWLSLFHFNMYTLVWEECHDKRFYTKTNIHWNKCLWGEFSWQASDLETSFLVVGTQIQFCRFEICSREIWVFVFNAPMLKFHEFLPDIMKVCLQNCLINLTLIHTHIRAFCHMLSWQKEYYYFPKCSTGNSLHIQWALEWVIGVGSNGSSGSDLSFC